MKKVRIKYNPYLITTKIEVDGKAPKRDSDLNVATFRLQEWIDRLPQILIDEYRDRNFEIEFTGTLADYNDVVAAVKAYGDSIDAKCIHHATPNIDEVETEVDKIFDDIKKNEIAPELKTPEIIEAFEKTKDSMFEINVVATMSSGKSTLINALLGQQLMPAANEATTATIVKIVDTDSDHFSAIAYDKSGNKVSEVANVTLKVMKELNSDERVTKVELRGKIPFVKSTGMKLVLVDTPGPNNSRDKRHEEMTYGMIADSDKSLVLYVMNGTQLGINDEKEFLDFICKQMQKGGKQSRERFIFAVNKMDSYRPAPKHDGPGCITRALGDAKKGLEGRGIVNPNLFPVASLPALQIRELDDDDDEVGELTTFTTRSRKYDEMQFEKYYGFSNLPQSARQNIDGWVVGALHSLPEDEEERNFSEPGKQLTEIYTGIVSVEQAISMYVNKYARTQKIKDLVEAFNGKLEEMATIAQVQDSIAKDKEKAAELEQQIAQIRKNIEAGKKAKNLTSKIDNIDLSTETREEVKKYISGVQNQINKMISGDNRVEKSEAIALCKALEKQCKSLQAQINVEISKILDRAYKRTLTAIIEEYKKHLVALNLGIEGAALSFSPIALVSSSLANLNNIIDDNTEAEDEGKYVTKTRKKEGGFFRQAASFLTFGAVDSYTIEHYEAWQSKWVDYVDMAQVTTEYLEPFQRTLRTIQDSAIAHVEAETTRLKEHLKKELVKIDEALDAKLNELNDTQANSDATAAEIAKNEEKLQWLNDIKQRVQNIINF